MEQYGARKKLKPAAEIPKVGPKRLNNGNQNSNQYSGMSLKSLGSKSTPSSPRSPRDQQVSKSSAPVVSLSTISKEIAAKRAPIVPTSPRPVSIPPPVVGPVKGKNSSTPTVAAPIIDGKKPGWKHPSIFPASIRPENSTLSVSPSVIPERRQASEPTFADPKDPVIAEEISNSSVSHILFPRGKQPTTPTVAGPVIDGAIPKKSVIAPPKRVGSTSRENSAMEISTPKANLVDCFYHLAGCTAKFPSGSPEEKEHREKCFFRPIKCPMHHICTQSVPFQIFHLHLMKHFITPTFTTNLNTVVYFEKDDFERDNRWHPRWMNCYKRDFFVMISHKGPGLWYFWVWMMGTPEEAQYFFYDAVVYKGPNRKVGTFLPVLSLRTEADLIEARENCRLSITDFQIKRISQIGENLVGSFELDLTIYREDSPGTSRTLFLEETS